MGVRTKVLQRKCREGFFQIRNCWGKREALISGSGERKLGEKPPQNLFNHFICQGGGLQMCVGAHVNVLCSMEQLQGTSFVHNKAIHLVYDSFNVFH